MREQGPDATCPVTVAYLERGFLVFVSFNDLTDAVDFFTVSTALAEEEVFDLRSKAALVEVPHDRETVSFLLGKPSTHKNSLPADCVASLLNG